MASPGRRDKLPLGQAEKIRAVMRSQLVEKFDRNLASYGRALGGMRGESISLLVGGKLFDLPPKNNPSAATGTEVARVAGMRNRFWEDDDGAISEIPQLSGATIRFVVDGKFAVDLKGVPPSSLRDALRRLPHDRIRRAAIAVIFSHGASIETVTAAALKAYEKAGSIRDSEELGADQWAFTIGQVVAGMQKISGSYPKLELLGGDADPPSPAQEKKKSSK